jgi:hypothetical protein
MTFLSSHAPVGSYAVITLTPNPCRGSEPKRAHKLATEEVERDTPAIATRRTWGLRGAKWAKTSGCSEILGPPWPLFRAGGLVPQSD